MNGRAKAACAVALAATVFAAPGARAESTPAGASVFVQTGTAGSTQSLAVGLTSDWGTGWSIGPGRLGGYWEASVAEWSYPGEDGGRTHLTHFGAKPVLRYGVADAAPSWFVEAGIGVTVTNRPYVSERKTFSTRFNFGDHLGVGRAFGDGARHELALRVEHFSNGGVRQPNPGKTFVQLRYAYRFR